MKSEGFFDLVLKEPKLGKAMERFGLKKESWDKAYDDVLILTKPLGAWDIGAAGVGNYRLNVHFEARDHWNRPCSKTVLRVDCGYLSRESAEDIYGKLVREGGLPLLSKKEEVYKAIRLALTKSSKLSGRLKPELIRLQPLDGFDHARNQSVLKFPHSGLGQDAYASDVADFFAEVIYEVTDDLERVVKSLKSNP